MVYPAVEGDTMKKEFLFAAVAFDEHSGDIFCAKCGRKMHDSERMRRAVVGDWLAWACEQCAGQLIMPSESVGTMREVIFN